MSHILSDKIVSNAGVEQKAQSMSEDIYPTVNETKLSLR